ncbi:Spo0B domain-containing protein [Pelosinus sp. sgz500959]|uniref:Spo0B domain-containing protein n=1 Tax=Pelosinus sp. sgz500959 TaxID=3242472 RepID=UPI003670C77C
MENHEIDSESVNLLKIQRHDFINHLQVIHALLQLGRTEKALIYIEELAKDSRLISDTLARYEEQGRNIKKA